MLKSSLSLFVMVLVIAAMSLFGAFTWAVSWVVKDAGYTPMIPAFVLAGMGIVFILLAGAVGYVLLRRPSQQHVLQPQEQGQEWELEPSQNRQRDPVRDPVAVSR